MPITHATTTATIGEAQWNEAHDLTEFTLDEVGEGTTNKPFTATLKTKLDGVEDGANNTTQAYILARSFLKC